MPLFSHFRKRPTLLSEFSEMVFIVPMALQVMIKSNFIRQLGILGGCKPQNGFRAEFWWGFRVQSPENSENLHLMVPK